MPILENCTVNMQKAVDYLEKQDFDNAIDKLEYVEEVVQDILQVHWNILVSDYQYEDPEMWDYAPIHRAVKAALDPLYDVHRWYDEHQGLDEIDVSNIEKAKYIIETCIKNTA